jgi:hypothetical protein
VASVVAVSVKDRLGVVLVVVIVVGECISVVEGVEGKNGVVAAGDVTIELSGGEEDGGAVGGGGGEE